MKRSLSLGLLCGSLLLVGCKDFVGIEIDPRVLIPKDANLVVGFEVEPIRQSPMGEALHALMAADTDMRALSTSVEACKLDVSKMKGMFATTMDDDRMVGFIEAPGIGEDDMVRCLEKESGKVTGQDSGLILFEDRGKVRVTPQEGGGYLVMLNKNAIAVVDKAWETEFFAAVENESARNTESAVVEAIAGIDAGTDLWLSFEPSDVDRAGMVDMVGFDELRGLSLQANLSDGLESDLRLDFGDEAKAKVSAETMETVLGELKPSLGEMGFSETLLDAAKPRVEGGVVNLEFQVSKEAFPGFISALGPLMAE